MPTTRRFEAMKVQLIDYTGAGHPNPARYAAERLVFTKNTRLEMKPGLLEEIGRWSDEAIDAELAYMANTIPSSWEFIDYTFLITDVTRAFTHQFVRTRTGSYAQQTMRVLDVEGWTYGTGPSIEGKKNLKQVYDEAMGEIDGVYRWLIEQGAKIEDARGVLPTNIHTNIVAKFNLRTMADTARKRASSRTQGEYRSVMETMKSECIRVHPWVDKFFNRTFDVAAAELEEKIKTLCGVMRTGDIVQTGLIKLIDQMRAAA
jgi:flavin-dependent thymidylate synthase